MKKKLFTLENVVLVLVGILGAITFSLIINLLAETFVKSTSQELTQQVDLPAIKNFQEKRMMKMIIELRDREDLVCYAYICAKNTGKLVYLGQCLGYGLPYAVQYTNPEEVVDGNVLTKADANGLYMPYSVSATWLMMIDKDGEPRPVYVEPAIVVSPFKLD